MPAFWSPPLDVSPAEERILSRCGKRKIFVFLRRHRHELFDDEFQARLIAMYADRERGMARVPPALLCMATLLQAALDVPDHEAVELTLDSARWRMVLDFEGTEKPAFSQGTLFNFRERLMKHDLDKVLLERTVQLARKTRSYSPTRLRAAFDASPLWGAGRVEDTFNLIGRALWHVVRTAAEQRGLSPEDLADRAGASIVLGSSIKAGLDLDWDDPGARTAGLRQLLAQVEAVAAWLRREMADDLAAPPLKDDWETLQHLIDQDTEPDPDDGGPRIRRGVARDRQISLSDPDMRHGRKSKSKLFNGYKRHVATDLDIRGLIAAVAVTPANQPEHTAALPLLTDCESLGRRVGTIAIDRGYLGAEAIRQRHVEGDRVVCKPFPSRNHGRFTKQDFQIDLSAQTVTCPNGVVRPVRLGRTVLFPAGACGPCPQRERCTRSKAGRGRTLSIHPAEPLLAELHERLKTDEGRKELRERVVVEHTLAAVGLRQGRRARYRGLRKNLFDLRRHAAVNNIYLFEERVAA